MKKWVEEMEETGTSFGWTETDKLIVMKRLLEGLAKIFVQDVSNLTTWSRLKAAVCEEFVEKLNGANLHHLMNRKNTEKESESGSWRIVESG